MIEFDKSKILTCVTADQAKVGDIGWFGDTLPFLKGRVGNEEPMRLGQIVGEAQYHRFVTYMNLAYALFYPAPYEYLQAKWVEENGLKVGDKVRTTRAWEEGEGGFGYSTTVAKGEVAYKVVNIRKDYIMGAIQAHLFYLPYFAIEKVKEPEYRPFASAEEFAPHRYRCWITRREGTYQRMLVTEYNSSGIRVGKSYISYKELVKDYIFVDTGKPAGVKV